MNEIVNNYIRLKNIDSFQKLRLLLFLYQHPHLKATSQEFANRLHLGDTFLMETIIAGLVQVGLVAQVGNHYQLPDEPEVKSHLQYLAHAFDHPVTRQELLKQVKPKQAALPARDANLQVRWLLS